MKALRAFVSSIVVLGIIDEICKKFGEIRNRLRKKGELIANFDVLIASTALVYGLTVLTNNVEHFKKIKKLQIMSEQDWENSN